MKVEYGSIGKQITMRADLGELSSRDKLQLLTQLQSDLGITDRLLSELDRSNPFFTIWQEQYNKHW
jgi:hypothetical protein